MSFSENVAELVTRSESRLVQCAPHWERVELGAVASISNGHPWKSDGFKSGNGVPVIRIRNVVSGSTETFFDGQIVEGYWVHRNDLLVGMDGDFNCNLWEGPKALLNQRVCKIDALENHYNKYFLRKALPPYLSLINKNTSSVTVKHLSSKTLAQIPLPLPPLAEQKRIVAKLDALSAHSARARKDLARIDSLVTRYKQAILSKAFSGELTTDWRIVRSDDAAGWLSTMIGNEADLRLGKMLDKAKNKGESTRYLRNINVRWGSFDLSDLLSMKMTDEERSKFDVKDGDLMVCEGGEPGRCAVWQGGATEISFQKALLRVRTKANLDANFLYHQITWLAQIKELDRHFTGTTIKHLPQTALARVPLQLAPLAEQKEIVRRIESAFDKIDRLAAEAKRALELTDKLDEAILAKAFRGELVPQDPTDEPASTLLARIKANRAAAPKPKRGRGKRV
ncbi:restriction endonuclease subunit S [Roseibium sediminis]|uniref:restriction endonuclease subunit S n=1 Tax=Roseibium sediminis TaxID=1775174 RepID=UPI00123D3572|nr:restriction endonuclease subunit S [Roseibium sediminis]